MTTPRPVLVYDGDCAFCTRSAGLARRWVDRRGRYAVQAWQQLDLPALGLTPAQCEEAAQFVTPDGRIRSGHRAIAAALLHGAPGWRPLGALLVAPGVSPMAARVYRWVADHRDALPGGTAACREDGRVGQHETGDRSLRGAARNRTEDRTRPSSRTSPS